MRRLVVLLFVLVLACKEKPQPVETKTGGNATDRNPATGLPPLFGSPGQDIGAEFQILMFGVEFGVVDLERRTGEYIGSFPITSDASGFEFAIPLAALDGDDGTMDVVGVVGTNFGPTDWFPDSGHGTIYAVSLYAPSLWLVTAGWFLRTVGGRIQRKFRMRVGVALEAHVRLRLAQRLLAQGRRDEASRELGVALAFYRGVGAVVGLREAEALLSAAG